MNKKRLASWIASLVLVIPLFASPSAANADYATCKHACERNGGSSEECHDICR